MLTTKNPQNPAPFDMFKTCSINIFMYQEEHPLIPSYQSLSDQT